MRNGRYCYPLTVVDSHSRCVLACQALLSTQHRTAQPVFERLFAEHGLPRAIRTDNGTPFASTALGRLSRLSVWWIELGIRPELIQPAHPEQNGSHERMHRTLARAVRPPAHNRRDQQIAFDLWREEFNRVRPHEALGQNTPSDLYLPSPRRLPQRLPPFSYPAHFEVRRVSRNGGIRWGSRWVNVTHVLAEKEIGLEEVDDQAWTVYFRDFTLGRFHERDLLIRGGKDPDGQTRL
jgi:hypothetical protein